MHFGTVLRLLRRESGLSLRDLARRLSVSGAYLSRVENGLDATPTPARLEAMALELGIPAPLLMDVAHRVSPLVIDYVDRVPAAGTLFLEIAQRSLNARQIAELRNMLDERFPTRAKARRPITLIAPLLTKDKVLLRFTCSAMEDVLDVAAGRLAPAATRDRVSEIATTLATREHEISSAIGAGVAVPCAFLAHTAPGAVLITLASPLPHPTPDGQPLRLVLVLAGPNHAADRSVRLAHVARLASRGLADELTRAGSAADVISRLALLESL
jgi:nitrogen PTS system EIIA component